MNYFKIVEKSRLLAESAMAAASGGVLCAPPMYGKPCSLYESNPCITLHTCGVVSGYGVCGGVSSHNPCAMYGSCGGGGAISYVAPHL